MSSAAFDIVHPHWQPHARSLIDQRQRAALSTQLNIAEGYALRLPSRFVYHLTIAFGSAVETVELFQLGVEDKVIPEQLAAEATTHGKRCQALLPGLITKYCSP